MENKNKKDVKNVDLWKKLMNLVKFSYVEWNWVKGHSGNKYNDEVDRIAKKRSRKNLNNFQIKSQLYFFLNLVHFRQIFL